MIAIHLFGALLISMVNIHSSQMVTQDQNCGVFSFYGKLSSDFKDPAVLTAYSKDGGTIDVTLATKNGIGSTALAMSGQWVKAIVKIDRSFGPRRLHGELISMELTRAPAKTSEATFKAPTSCTMY